MYIPEEWRNGSLTLGRNPLPACTCLPALTKRPAPACLHLHACANQETCTCMPALACMR